MNKFVSGCLLVSLSCFCVFACHKKEDDSAYTTNIAVSHFILNVDSLSVLYDDSRVTGSASLSYGVSTNLNSRVYLKVGAGTHDVKLLTGTRLLRENILTSGAGKYYSLILYDSIKNDTIKAAYFQDVITPVDTMAQARFINTVPGTDSLTINLIKDNTGVIGSDIYIGNKTSPAYPFNVLRPGSWQVSLLRNNIVIAQQNSVKLDSGRLYTFIAKGIKNATGAYKESLVVVRNF